MDLDLSSDQDLFLDTTRRFLTTNWPTSAVRDLIGQTSRIDRELWDRGAELGWTSMLVPEEFGGGSISGAGVHDVAIVAEEMGRFLVPGPVIPTNVVAFALGRNPSDGVSKEHLPLLASGRLTAAWAAGEDADPLGSSGSVRLEATENGFTITGVKGPVQDADAADVLLVTVVDGSGATQLLVPSDSPGVTIEPLEGLDLARRHCRVSFEDVEVTASAVVGLPGQAAPEARRQLALWLTLQCAETVGATDRLFEMTLQYVKDRKSFGRPIGSYQALKHRLADMLLWSESAKAATSAAAAAVQSDACALDAASVAKAYVADRCPVIARECLQMHGGIGYTWEHDLHLFLRRVESNAALSGGPQFALDHIAESVGL